uniref:Uncharacterized protein n=1 Tax=Chenopodium quinoa TaxID=63459 RepID=A0A803MAT6_CHEQI
MILTPCRGRAPHLFKSLGVPPAVKRKRSQVDLTPTISTSIKLQPRFAGKYLLLLVNYRRFFGLLTLWEVFGVVNFFSSSTMGVFEELRGDLYFAQFEEEEFSSHKLEKIVGELENPFGVLKLVSSLKDEGNQLYKQSNMVLAIAKYSFALKILSFVLRNFDKVGQLCSTVLCYDNSNAKAYFRRAVAALELNKRDLAFMDHLQAIRIEPNNKEFQQKPRR